MNGALEPKRALLSCCCCMMLIARTSSQINFMHSVVQGLPFLPLRERLHVAARGAGEELPRPADFLVRVGDHLVPLSDPADGPCQNEDRGEQAHRDSDRALDDARVEVDVRIELALDE